MLGQVHIAVKHGEYQSDVEDGDIRREEQPEQDEPETEKSGQPQAQERADALQAEIAAPASSCVARSYLWFGWKLCSSCGYPFMARRVE